MTDPFSDAGRSGVYRAACAEAIQVAARAQGLRVARVMLSASATKRDLLGALAAELEFPDWFGANWDALEDCLTDPEWIGSEGCLILFEGYGGLASDDFEVLRQVLECAAQFWSTRGKSFFAVFVGGPDSLPEIGGAVQA